MRVWLLLGCLFASAASPAAAQETPKQEAEASASSEQTAQGAVAPASGYRIGRGDLLDVRVTTAKGKNAELSADGLEVGDSGEVQVYDGPVQAACLTTAELAAKIRERFLKYKRDPLGVSVSVREYRSQTVAVMGAVKKPGPFELRRPTRLLELLAIHAGGPDEPRAGDRVVIVHTAAPQRCDGSPAPEDPSAVSSYELARTVRGEEGANPYLRPGDVVSVPAAEEPKKVYVVGNVVEPTAIDYDPKEPVTLYKAIARARGTMPDTKSDKVLIIRQVPGTLQKTEIVADLEAIKRNRAPDIELLPEDVVDVPVSGGKRLLRSLTGIIAPTVGQIPVRVIR